MRDVDARADVWSLGVMLFRMLVGELPFVADSYARMLVRIISDDQAPRVRTRNPEIPRDLDAIVARCLEKSPAGRYLSMTELLAALPRGAAPAGDTARAADHLAPTSPRESTDSGTRESPGGSAPVATGAPTVVARPGSGATPATRAPQPSSRSATPPTRQPPQPIAPASPGRVAPSSGSQPLGSATPARSPIPRAPAATAPPIVRGGPSSAGAPFDAVVLTDGPRPRRVSAEEFFALPLSARIQHVISRTVTFLKDGVEVDRQEALARMRERFAK
jgi:serine/threonine-protein kinase